MANPRKAAPPRKPRQRKQTAAAPPPSIREKLAALMRATLADEAASHDWTYAAVRPMPVPVSWHPGAAVRGDCSKAVQYLCKWVGAPDPMGNGFSDYGNSTTICAHLAHLDSAQQLEVGDIVTFGPNGDEHATMVYGADPVSGDPLLWSFGRPGAPNAYKLSQDGREAQYLRLPVPPVQWPPPSVLKGRTGYWSWLAWKLGEGDWRNYGKSNSGTRPGVPARIPLAWWRRYASFLLARKKPNPPTR